MSKSVSAQTLKTGLAEEEMYELITELSGVRLADIDGAYQVDWPDSRGRIHHSIFTEYPAAEACFVHQVEEVDYR